MPLRVRGEVLHMLYYAPEIAGLKKTPEHNMTCSAAQMAQLHRKATQFCRTTDSMSPETVQVRREEYDRYPRKSVGLTFTESVVKRHEGPVWCGRGPPIKHISDQIR